MKISSWMKMKAQAVATARVSKVAAREAAAREAYGMEEV